MTNAETNPIKVLLVDDDEDDFLLTKYLFDDFKDKNYSLEWTSDGARALDSMKHHRHDIYFVDYRLGSFDGLEILSEAVAAGCISPGSGASRRTSRPITISPTRAPLTAAFTGRAATARRSRCRSPPRRRSMRGGFRRTGIS